MKQILIIILCLILIFSLVSCKPKDKAEESAISEDPASSVEESSIEPSEPVSSEIEFSVREELPQVADASQYRGSVTEINKQEDGTYKIVIEEYKGTSYGAKKINVEINESTMLNIQPADIVIGNYLEVYYGSPIEAGIDEVVSAIMVKFLGEAQYRNYNGIVKEVNEYESGKGNILMTDLDGGDETQFNYDTSMGTQMYLNFPDIVQGTKLSIFHDIAVTSSLPPQIFALEVRMYDDGTLDTALEA